jgi:acetyl/propionyl-CoA carboxylase alpha subunit
VLIANRGEVAARIATSCRRLGISAVGVYTKAEPADWLAAHVEQMVCLGEGPVAGSFMDENTMLQAALQYRCQAIHPGYGFLSESAHFAQRCALSGLTFIGPSVAFLRLAGDKHLSREWASQHGLPCLPGTGPLFSLEALRAEAARLSYPVMLKARHSGGGRGLLRCADEASLEAAWRSLAAEHRLPGVLLEVCLDGARHLEFQYLGDRYGGLLRVGERDCSVQRKHQKLFEESPPLGVEAEKLEALARRIERGLLAVGGLQTLATFEFLLAPSGDFYFLEINPRLQVEHGVSELCSGLDLVEWQLRLAANEPIAEAAKRLQRRGHAIEVRIVAEDPSRDWMPCLGRVERLDFDESLRFRLEGPCRVDTHLQPGAELTPYYDSLLAKLLAHGDSREQALERMAALLEAFSVEGVCTNLELMRGFVGRALEAPARPFLGL